MVTAGVAPVAGASARNLGHGRVQCSLSSRTPGREGRPCLLLIGTEFPPGPGGIGAHNYQIALGLTSRGWNVVVLTPQDYANERQIESFNRELPFRIFRFSSRKGGVAAAVERLGTWASAAFRTRDDGLILANGVSAIWLAAAARAITKWPTVGIAVGIEMSGQTRGSGLLNRVCLEHFDMCVANSQFTANRIRRANFGVKRLEVVHPGADEKIFHPLETKEPCRSLRESRCGAGPVLVTVGHVSERKGQEIVIRALPRLRMKYPEICYVMIGLPTLESKLRSIARDLGVEDALRFESAVPTEVVVRWLNAADVFVMTSRNLPDGDTEGFGIAAVEAALCGLPSVVSRDSGLVEAIEPGVTGLAVPNEDPDATATAISELLSDSGKRTVMGMLARERALKEQTWGGSINSLEHLLLSVAHGVEVKVGRPGL